MPTSKTKAGPRFYTVPAGTPSSQCRGTTCRAVIYWITSPDSGRPMPIDCDVDGGEAPSAPAPKYDKNQLDAFPRPRLESWDGTGVSHFTTCPDVGQFSRKA